ncbi:hypothetical protein SAMN05421493_102116 [Pseudobutyrivibrio sp. 49]|uniref:hypothetical protein n=1 Tax=Pseudobutyrivibrio sp. 49 TaxID=1855344 RepID=UPI000883160B|nr:hypothetical protein [Pseudobutyrivibrio sp. 49]SDH61126.1 hypothetical protein SAMN05421493_102116 [Pseudobutyrivibrio sp. 49]
MANAIKKIYKPIIIAIAQWILTTAFQVDRLFFRYDAPTIYFYIVKATYAIVLVITWCFIFFVFQKLKERDAVYIRGAQIFLIYFLLVMVLLTILWPGTWAWDDINTLESIVYYTSFFPWNNIITGLYQDILLQLLPFPGGIIFLQNLIISLCVAAVVVDLESILDIKVSKNVCIDTLVKIIPFFLPPVLMYQFSGYRMGLYVYLELLLIVKIITAKIQGKEWTWSTILFVVFLCVIVSTWRTESIVYIPGLCVLILFLSKNIFPKNGKIICILAIVIGYIFASKCQSFAARNNDYQMISLLCPGGELVRCADIEADKVELEMMDRVTDLEYIRNNPEIAGQYLYWGGCVRTGYTKAEYNDYIKALVRLSLKYPKVVFEERMKMFIKSTNIFGDATTNVNTAEIFDEGITNSAQIEAYTFNWFAYRPIFKDLRKGLVNVLCCRNSEGEFIGVLYKIIWNALIPIIILLVAWIRLLVKKQWFLWGICTAVIVRIPIIILTEPAGWIMYLLSFYFMGYVCLFYMLLRYISQKRKASEVE